MVKGIEAVEEVKDFLNRKCPTCGRSKADLIMTDVPKATLKQFKEFANSEEFSCEGNKGGHYGFALKFLLDYYIGRIPDGLDMIEAKADMALEKISELEIITPEEEKKSIHLVNGKELKLGG